MRDASTRPGLTVIVRRGKTDDDVLSKKTDILVKQNIPVPNNHRTLLSSKYYLQFREWYSVFMTMKCDRTPEQMAWMRTFKFDFNVAPPGGYPRNNHCNERLLDRPGIRDIPITIIVHTTRDMAVIGGITAVIVAVTIVVPITIEAIPPGVE